MPEIIPFFAVPFGTATLDNCASLNAELRTLFLQRAAAGNTYANPFPLAHQSPHVFESSVDLFRVPEKPVQQLREFCLRELVQMIIKLSGYDEATGKRLLIQHDSWFRVTRRGGYLGLHNHPNASWSGIYCIDPGHADPDKPDSGVVSFVSPMLATGLFNDAGNANLQGPYAPQLRHVRLEPGQLLLFPAWVLHSVMPYEGNGDRLTVSFTCSFGLADPAAPATA